MADALTNAQIAEMAKAVISPIWFDYEYIAIRAQQDGELRTNVSDALRPSCEWVDGVKSRRKLSGTAGFAVRSLSEIDQVIEQMDRFGYIHDGMRLVVIASDAGCNDHDMPERYATAVRDARLIAVICAVNGHLAFERLRTA